MPDQKQHAKITPELEHLWTCICLESNPAAALQNFADALRDARLDEAKWWANRTPDRPHSSACALDCIYGARIAALERGKV